MYSRMAEQGAALSAGRMDQHRYGHYLSDDAIWHSPYLAGEAMVILWFRDIMITAAYES